MLLRNIDRAFCSFFKQQIRFYQHWPETKAESPFMPPNKADRKLSVLPTTPTLFPDGTVLPIKYPKAWLDMRGPERIHNQLIYKQYGIIALGGGSLRAGHLDVIRDTINRHIDTDRMFAVWRIDPPWKSVSKKSLGKKMGGGKAKVHHYETPVKAGRVIIEVGGIGHYGEISRYLNNVCQLLPLDAIPVSQEILDEMLVEKKQLDAQNFNPFRYRELVRNNFSDATRKVSKYELLWGGEYF